MYDIVSIGSSTRDVLMKSEQFKIIEDKQFSTGQAECFALGSKIEIKDIVFSTGGGGTNAAVTFSRQGLKTACIGVVGKDADGEELLRELKSERIDTKYFQKHDDEPVKSSGEDHGPSRTAYSVILVHPSAERTILSYKGEGQHFDASKIPFNKIKTKWLFLDSLGGHYDLLEKAVNWAKERGIKIATNPGGKELAHGLEKLKPLFESSEIVIMNQEEAGGLVGIDFRNEEEIFKLMDRIVRGIFVMTKGPEGAVASDGKNIYRAGVPDSPVVERTGAGDAFTSGFIVEYVKSEKLKMKNEKEIIERAIQFATANASSVVTKFGAKAGILRKGDWGPWPLVEIY